MWLVEKFYRGLWHFAGAFDYIGGWLAGNLHNDDRKRADR